MKRNFLVMLLVSVVFISCSLARNVLNETIKEKNISKENLIFFDYKTYDQNGNILFEKWSDGFECEYYYNEKGELKSSKQNTGITTVFQRIDECKVIEKWSNGMQILNVYDDNKNLIKQIFSETSYIEYYFDANGKETHFISSSGNTSWNYYNKEGLLNYRKDSKGNEYFYEYEFYPNNKIKKRTSYIYKK